MLTGRRSEEWRFALAAAFLVLTAAVIGFVADLAFAVMGALCVAGLVMADRVGVSRQGTTVLAAGFGVIIWTVAVLGPLAPPKVASTVAHLMGGALVGWAIARLAVRRLPGASAPLLLGVSLGLLLIVGVAWELAESVADALLDTDLAPRLSETALDLAANLAGGLAGGLFAWRQSRAGRARAGKRAAPA